MTFSVLPLAEIACINPAIPRSLPANEEVAFVPMAAVNAEDINIVTNEVRHAGQLKNGFSYFENDDVLLAKITPCFENGKIGLARIKQPCGFGSTEFHVIRAVAGTLYPRFLAYYLRQQSIRETGERKMTGSAGQRRVPKHFLEQLKIPLPPVDEQKRIASILDATDALRIKRRTTLSKLTSLPQSVFVSMFGGLDDNTDCQTLGQFVTFVTSGGRGWAKYYASSGSRFIRSLDVQMNYLGSENIAFVDPPDNAEAIRTRVQAEDVLLTITGSRIGRVASVPADLGPAYISQHVAILRVDRRRLLPQFLSFYLSLPFGGQRLIRQAQYGQTKPGLNFEQIKAFKVLVPSMDDQKEFCRRTAEIAALRRQLTVSSAQLDSLFTSLEHRAFRGEL